MFDGPRMHESNNVLDIPENIMRAGGSRTGRMGSLVTVGSRISVISTVPSKLEAETFNEKREASVKFRREEATIQ